MPQLQTFKDATPFLIFQRYLVRSTVIEKYLKSSKAPTIYVADVTLSFNETFTFQWIFAGLNVNVSQCRLDSGRVIVQPCQSNNTEYLIEEPEIVIHNSSFGNLDLNPGTKAQITDCHINGEFKDRPTLITANNSEVSIQNCQLRNFINEKGSTILFGHNNSHVTIENSDFIQHNSSKGSLFLQNTSSLLISSSKISQNVAFTLGYSAITLLHGINADVHNTVFNNNSALVGGALIAEDRCQVVLSNCTFFSNKAITGKTLTVLKNTNVEMTASSSDINGTFTPWSQTSFNQTRLQHRKPESRAAEKLNISKRRTRQHRNQKSIGTIRPTHAQPPADPDTLFNQTSSHPLKPEAVAKKMMNISRKSTPIVHMLFNQTSLAPIEPEVNVSNQTHRLMNSSVLKITAQQVGYLPGIGGLVSVASHSHLFVRNCVFEDNLAEKSGGAIIAGLNATLNIGGTTFVRNKALEQGGAIDVEDQAQLRITNCTFTDNHAEQFGGAIVGGFDAVLQIQDTNFTRNRALQGGAINVQQQVNVSLTNCRLDCNFAKDLAGAILAMIFVTLEIRETNFTGNSASHYGGALFVLQAECHIVRSIFHGNTAKTGNGGAVCIQSESSLKIENTNFTNNNSSDGGAICMTENSKLQANMCSFWENVAAQSGGVINLNDYSTAVIERCHFLSNYAGSGGALELNNLEQISVRDTVFLRNEASGDGGAIEITSGTVFINNITCTDNHAEGNGGCLKIGFVTLTLNNSEISKNVAQDDGAGVAATNSRMQVSLLTMTKICTFTLSTFTPMGKIVHFSL